MLFVRIFFLVCILLFGFSAQAQSTESENLLAQAEEIVLHKPIESNRIAQHILKQSESPSEKSQSFYLSALSHYVMGNYDQALSDAFSVKNQVKKDEILYAKSVDNGTVVLSSTAGNYMWTEAGGLVTLNTFTNGTNNSGNPSISKDGTRISATVTNPNNNLNEMGVYDVATNSWSYLGGIGGSSDGNVSSSWSMSGDGQVVVGLGWVNAGTAHAIKWSQAGGMVDMGSTVTGRSTRANDANLDGSITVGWQDSDFGFRQAAIWEGTTQTLIFDQDGMEVNEAGAVSEDGNWVIGGDYDFNAWKWSEATGVEAISHPNAGMWFRGASTGVNSDGSKIVGYYRPWPGGPYFGEGFIWTEETGRVSLNDYVDGLGIDRQGISLNLPLGISSDGSMDCRWRN